MGMISSNPLSLKTLMLLLCPSSDNGMQQGRFCLNMFCSISLDILIEFNVCKSLGFVSSP